MSLERPGFSNGCVSFAELRENPVTDHLRSLGVLKKSEGDPSALSERDLIANRLKLRNIAVDDAMSICPKHRSSFGVDWFSSTSVCHHPNHNPRQRPKGSDCRRATLRLCNKIDRFPIGGRLVEEKFGILVES